MRLSNLEKSKVGFDVILSILIAIIPYSLFLYLLFDPNEDFIILFHLKLNHEYESNAIMIWNLMGSVIPLLLMTLFYCNVNYNWKKLLLPIIGFEFVSSIFVLLNDIGYLELLFSLTGSILFLIGMGIAIIIDQFLFKPFSKISLKINHSNFLRFVCEVKLNPIIEKSKEIIKLKESISGKNYSHRLLHMQQLTHEKLNFAERVFKITPTRKKSPSAQTTISIFLLGVSLFLLVCHLILPKDAGNFHLFGCSFDSFGFKSFRTFLWYLNRKLAYILILLVWLLNSDQWWRWVILSPMSLYILQLSDIFTNRSLIEEQSNLILFPLIIVSTFLIISFGKTICRSLKIFQLESYLKMELNETIRILACRENIITFNKQLKSIDPPEESQQPL